MEYCILPKNLKLGASYCVVKILGGSRPFSVRWCAEKDYPDKLTAATPGFELKVNKNGTYVVELTAGEEKTLTEFSICHLKPASGFSGGDGSPESPYLISTCAQFTGIRSNLRAHYRLTADLHFEREMKNLCWLPIGKFSQKEPHLDPNISVEDQSLSYVIEYGFTGELDGDGHTIFGLTCNRPKADNVGIFGSCGDGVYIHNIKIENCYFSGDGAGTIAGRAEYASLIEKCSIQHTSVKATTIGGGVVGEAAPGTIFRACEFNGKLTGEDVKKPCWNLGGIVGSTRQGLINQDLIRYTMRYTHIEDCCVKAEIKAGRRSSGIMTGVAIVSRCFFSGTIEGVLECAGITASGSNSLIRNCVCVNAEIYHMAETPISVCGSTYGAFWNEDETECESEYIENAYINTAGRIMCDDYTLSPSEKQFINYGSISCKLRTKYAECPAIDGSLRDGITILEETAHDRNFYVGLGWDFDTIWTNGKDGLPQIR